MEAKLQENVNRLIIRLEDARMEVRNLTTKVEYPNTSKLERVNDALETAEKYLKEII